MSKFSERLSSLGQSAPAKMGFGASAVREKSPVMLVIGRGGNPAEDGEAVDLLLRHGGKGSEKGDWGLLVEADTEVDAEALGKSGCQFLLIASEDANAEVLLAEELGIGMPVKDGLPEHRIRAIEDGPFDFLLYRPAEINWPLTVGSVMLLQDLVSSFSKHIFLELPVGASMPGEKDLEVLKNLPVSAIVVDLDVVKPEDASKLKESIGKLEPRKPPSKGERSALVPLTGRNAADDVDAGDADGGYEDDGDDWDD